MTNEQLNEWATKGYNAEEHDFVYNNNVAVGFQVKTQINNIPVHKINNVNVSAATYHKEDDSYIHEVIQNDVFLLTADIDTPQNFKFTVMIERVADHHQKIDDIRLDATINQGKVTIEGYFPHTGNYILSCDRLNRGLERLGRQFRLHFDDIEFNSKLVIP